MNTTKLLLTAICLLAVNSTTLLAQSNSDYKVSIKQNGKLYHVDQKNAIKLSKSSFDIIIEMPKPSGMLVNASFDKETYKSLPNAADVLNIPCFAPGSGMADHKFNPENAIMAKSNGSNYLFYANDDEHRFNSVEKSGDKYVCTRTVERIFNVDNNSEISVNSIDQTLYLCFVSHNARSKEILYKNRLAIKWSN